MPMTPVVVAPDEAVIQHGKLLAPALVFKSLTPTRRFAHKLFSNFKQTYTAVYYGTQLGKVSSIRMIAFWFTSCTSC